MVQIHEVTGYLRALIMQDRVLKIVLAHRVIQCASFTSLMFEDLDKRFDSC